MGYHMRYCTFCDFLCKNNGNPSEFTQNETGGERFLHSLPSSPINVDAHTRFALSNLPSQTSMLEKLREDGPIPSLKINIDDGGGGKITRKTPQNRHFFAIARPILNALKSSCFGYFTCAQKSVSHIRHLVPVMKQKLRILEFCEFHFLQTSRLYQH